MGIILTNIPMSETPVPDEIKVCYTCKLTTFDNSKVIEFDTPPTIEDVILQCKENYNLSEFMILNDKDHVLSLTKRFIWFGDSLQWCSVYKPTDSLYDFSKSGEIKLYSSVNGGEPITICILLMCLLCCCLILFGGTDKSPDVYDIYAVKR